MPQTKLSFGESLHHELGAQAFQLRCGQNEWRAINVAVLAWSSRSVKSYSVAKSNPERSEHSEEQLLEMFDSQMEALEVDQINGLALYTERVPCTFSHGQAGTTPGYRTSNLPPALQGHQNATFERRNCAARLQQRFPDLQVYYTVISNGWHTAFLSFAQRWAALAETQKAVLIYVSQKVVQEKQASRLHVKCAGNHPSFIWVRPVWQVDEFLRMLTDARCPLPGCNQPLVVLGRCELNEKTLQWVTNNNHASYQNLMPNVQ